MPSNPALPFQLSLHPRAVALLLFLCFVVLLPAQPTAQIVYTDATGILRYQADNENNYISDFSHAGYKSGEAEIPTIPVVRTIQPVDGDDTESIQAALDEVAALPPDANGFRGALLLEAGAYEVSGQLFLRESGMVLRGVGQEATVALNTIIIGVGNMPELRNLIVVGDPSSSGWSIERPGTRSVVTSPFVPAGSRSLEVAAAELYRAGDQVIINHPSTAAWLASIGFGDTASDDPWTPGTIDIAYNRVITDVNIPEGKITLDAPIHDHLERSLSESTIYALNASNTVRETGIENLRIEIATAGEMDEEHVRTAIYLEAVEDCWLKDVTGLHFSYALVDMSAANRVTVTGCSALAPHSLITGARRYNFNVSRFSNNILFTGCRASEGRHSFVSNGTSSVSGIVWTDCVSEDDFSSSEGHRRWSQGLLFDKIDFINSNTATLLGLYSRGNFGTGHGWSSVNSVAWNVRTPSDRFIVIQKPPGRQNYGVGCVTNIERNWRFVHPLGYIELNNQPLAIPSLYAAQLAQRLATGALPDAPARLTGINNNGSTELEWLDIASRETGYVVLFSEDGGASFAVADSLEANATAFTDTDRGVNSTDVIYQVYAYGPNGPSPFSNPVAVASTNAVREAAAAELKIIPNPVNEQLTIATDLRLKEVVVYNASGKLVTRRSGTNQLNTSTWPAGFYYLRIETHDGKLRSVRFVKR
jgi:hypothetical protein